MKRWLKGLSILVVGSLAGCAHGLPGYGSGDLVIKEDYIYVKENGHDVTVLGPGDELKLKKELFVHKRYYLKPDKSSARILTRLKHLTAGSGDANFLKLTPADYDCLRGPSPQPPLVEEWSKRCLVNEPLKSLISRAALEDGVAPIRALANTLIAHPEPHIAFLVGVSYLHDDELHIGMFIPVDSGCANKVPCKFSWIVNTIPSSKPVSGASVPIEIRSHYGVVHGLIN